MKASSTSATKVIRVLTADDHPVVREGLVTILKSEKDIEVVAELLMERKPACSTMSLLPMWSYSISGCGRKMACRLSLT
jgi:hypothetical protein